MKNRENIRKHGIDFKDVVEMFKYPMLATVDNRLDYGEERWVGIGQIAGIVIVIAYTENDDNNEIRLISARKATKNENKRFKETIRY